MLLNSTVLHGFAKTEMRKIIRKTGKGLLLKSESIIGTIIYVEKVKSQIIKGLLTLTDKAAARICFLCVALKVL